MSTKRKDPIEKIIHTEWNKSDVNFETKGKRLLTRKELVIYDAVFVTATIVFIDIRDSTQLYGKVSNGATLAKILRIYHRILLYETRVLQFYYYYEIIGDGLAIVFDVRDKKDTERLLRSIAVYFNAVKKLNDHLNVQKLPNIKIGIGIETGDIMIAKIQERRSPFWLKKPINLASKLSDIANKDKIKEVVIGPKLSEQHCFDIKNYCNGLYGSDFSSDELQEIG